MIYIYRRNIHNICTIVSRLVYIHTVNEEERALLDFDGAEPGTTNEESENLRS